MGNTSRKLCRKKVDVMLPCPFCGSVPELPNRGGTQYEIECNCGLACSWVQICDLMTIEERMSDEMAAPNYSYAQKYVDRAKKEAIKQWNTRAA